MLVTFLERLNIDAHLWVLMTHIEGMLLDEGKPNTQSGMHEVKKEWVSPTSMSLQAMRSDRILGWQKLI